MSSNIVTARFTYGNSTKTRGLHQWDYGQVLKFEGLSLPSAYTVHFASQLLAGNAKTQVGGADRVKQLSLAHNRAMWCVTITRADGVQIARKSFGAFPDMTPAPEPEPEENGDE